MKPNISSQLRNDWLVFVAHILPTTTLRIRLAFKNLGKTLSLTWQPGRYPIFSEIFVCEETAVPTIAYTIAVRYFVMTFWQEQVCRSLQSNGVTYDRHYVQELASQTMGYFANTLLPSGLVLNIDQLLPETTRQNDWLGRRNRILRLTPLEKHQLKPRDPR